MDTNATYNVRIVCNLPDNPNGIIAFQNSTGLFLSSENESFPVLKYELQLDGTGAGDQLLPCPDNTGESGVRWSIKFPSGEVVAVTVSYSDADILLSDLLASATTVTTPDNILAALNGKINRIAVPENNIAVFDDQGGLKDSGQVIFARGYFCMACIDGETEQTGIGLDPVKLTCFNANGASLLAIPDHENDQITNIPQGVWLVFIHMTLIGTSNTEFTATLNIGGVTTQFKWVAEIGSDTITATTLCILPINESVAEVFINSDKATAEVTVKQAHLTGVQVG